ncbi:hypothetical protein I6N90_22680 [Paenibacillus sp. GSMTC-2017]|uniref:hypothetical protein n=1 Tax=Paenibacillus sp. GSMTC-2017 TaxID=2794350 RepID=UPI0018D892FD|nr:hypothetical protein [Paenibacillus sp. GSMTC-2017]MBH5320604.1 hypothetical protein [Paenibacillus sp. GSMTC-2017]
MKQKLVKIVSATVLVTAGVWIGVVIAKPLEANSGVTPGSIEDPVVTKSYVDEQIAKLNAGGSSGGNTGGSNGSVTETSNKLEVVEIPVGKTLIAAGGSEVVVRSGKAVAFSFDASGISDLTDGVDIKNGKNVPNNHLLWFPRDGRGVKGHADEKKSVTVIVKGKYSLK